jgi:serine/threonine-protein kinase HipA
MSLGGSQPKVSVYADSGELKLSYDLGDLILKPSPPQHEYASENEHFVMNIAKIYGFSVPPFCLVGLADRSYAFLIKRFDRVLKRKSISKIHTEDMASVLNRQADSKYDGAYSEIGVVIHKHVRDSGLELITLLDLVMFSYCVGNNDLHLKNIAIIDKESHYELSPIYDVLCSARYYASAPELALDLVPEYFGSLSIEGYYTAKDFLYLGTTLGLSSKVVISRIKKLVSFESKIMEMLPESFLNKEEQEKLRNIFVRQFEKFKNGSELLS